MSAEYWYILVGALLAGIAVSGELISRLPMSTAMVYFAVGILLGPHAFGLLPLDLLHDAALLERCAEVAVVISLFTAGLKLRVPLDDPKWRVAFRLAFLSMAITIVLATVAGTTLLELPLGPAILLGAVIAPTDPVLAAEVQVDSPFDRNPLRFGLTGEAGLNDGTAMPFVALGLALLDPRGAGASPLGVLAAELLAVVAGLGIGGVIGSLVGRHVLHLRIGHGTALGYSDFLALGLMGITYGLAELAHANGFLAVFAAGYGLRRIEMRRSAEEPVVEALPLSRPLREEIARDPEKGPQYLAESVLVFNEHYERVAEFTLVILLGAAFVWDGMTTRTWLYALLLLVVIRPVSVALGLVSSPLTRRERTLVGWLGLRGIGSVYYVTYALTHSGEASPVRAIVPVVLAAIGVSIVAHGLTATPLMGKYRRT